MVNVMKKMNRLWIAALILRKTRKIRLERIAVRALWSVLVGWSAKGT